MLILTIAFFGITLTARWISTNFVGVSSYAKSINSLLNKNESVVYSYLNNPKTVSEIRFIEHSTVLSEKWIKLLNAQSITLHTYKNNQLVFWSSNLINPKQNVKIPNGISFLQTDNGYYETIKKEYKNLTIVIFILIKSHYPFQNSFLKNSFNENIFNNKNFDIVDYHSAGNVKHIRSVYGKYLFSIKDNESSLPYTNLEIVFWFLGFCSLVLLLNSIFKYYADLGYPLVSSVGLGTLLFFMRLVSLRFRIPQALYHTDFFSPTLFGMNDFFPSLADFGLNIFVALWLIIFVNSYKNKIFPNHINRWFAYPVLFLFGFVVYETAIFMSDIFWGLVNNSQINFNVSNVLNLDIYSFISIFLLGLCLLFFYLLLNIGISFSLHIHASFKEKIIVIIGTFLLYGVWYVYDFGFSLYLVLCSFLIFIIIKICYQYKRIIFPSLVLLSLVFATIVSLKLTQYNNQKERETRKILALKLNETEDPNASYLFKSIESNLLNDVNNINFFSTNHDSVAMASVSFRKKYLRGYLTKFDYDIAVYDTSGVQLNGDSSNTLKKFKTINEGAVPLSKYFYRKATDLGKQLYYAIIPVYKSSTPLGFLLFEFSRQLIEDDITFATILRSKQVKNAQNFDNYSYALYYNNKLLTQTGDYIYNLINRDFQNHSNSRFTILKKNGFSHLIFIASAQKLIIISKETRGFWIELASLSFFFILFLTLGGIVIWFEWIWKILSRYDFKKLNFQFFFNTNKWLYKTRIQIALVMAVVCSLAIIGIITFSYISLQYKDQQINLLKYRVNIISKIFEQNYLQSKNIKSIKEIKSVFAGFSKMYIIDLNFYDVNGDLVFSDQPKVYDNNIISKQMDPIAYCNMHLKKKSLLLNEENIGKLNITSAYVPLLNKDNREVGYLQIPSLYNPKDYNQKIGSFLNLLINIYVLVFTAIGFFAFIVATQITSPLTLIQQSLSKTNIGKSNKPIPWIRDDEIGKLIKEYNIMLIALEESAEKLAQSERQTAWREMAKQVAHEIKNPLTPLRLGIQMIQRSWKEKDPNFEKKFEKFNSSFIEQIDNLSTIASDFSNFAKIPDAVIKELNLHDILHAAIQSFNLDENVILQFDGEESKKIHVLADENQLKVIFKSVIKNAIEAIPNGRKGFINIAADSENGYTNIRISDNGIGINEDLHDKIFSPNFNANSSGSGLGLAFAKNSLQNMDGNIHYQTAKQIGTTFFIRLPLSN